MKSIFLASETMTQEIASRISTCLHPPLVLTFSGEIGAGKTTFIRAMLQGMGVQSVIKSPTFSLIESYQYQTAEIHHFDLYRIQDETELEYIGFRDYFNRNAICCIEWPERVPQLVKADFCFTFTMHQDGRVLTMCSLSPVGDNFLLCLEGNL